MRRKEKEITDLQAIEAIIRRAQVCRLALTDGEHPYVIPLFFGYQKGALYFHSAIEGKKIELLRKNRNVCFEVDIDTEILKADEACAWGANYKSVIGFGKAVLLEDAAQKRKGLEIIMRHYASREFRFPDAKIEKTAVIRVEITEITGKQSDL